MKCHYLVVICLQVTSSLSAPIEMQWQKEMAMQPTQEELLQQQLVALQNLQMMSDWNNNVYPPLLQSMVQPLMIIMPDPVPNTRLGTNNNNVKDNDNKHVETDESNDKVTVNEDLDSVVIDAGSPMEPQSETHPQRLILLFPNRGRLGLGGLISAIPFLPIEINVPDTISWIYNGIAGIIGGIGQRWPFNRPYPTEMQPESLRVLLSRLQTKNQNMPSPVLILQDVAQMYPMQLQ